MSKIIKREVSGCHQCQIQHIYKEGENVYGNICSKLLITMKELGKDCYVNAFEVTDKVRSKIKEKYRGGFHKDCPLSDRKEDEGFVI